MVVLDVLTGCRKDMDRFEIPAIAQVCPEPGFDLLVHRVPVAPVFSRLGLPPAWQRSAGSNTSNAPRPGTGRPRCSRAGAWHPRKSPAAPRD